MSTRRWQLVWCWPSRREIVDGRRRRLRWSHIAFHGDYLIRFHSWSIMTRMFRANVRSWLRRCRERHALLRDVTRKLAWREVTGVWGGWRCPPPRPPAAVTNDTAVADEENEFMP